MSSRDEAPDSGQIVGPADSGQIVGPADSGQIVGPADSGQIVGPADVDRLARAMLLLHGAHDDDDHGHGDGGSTPGITSKAPSFGAERAAALREATSRDRERYLRSGLVSVDCRFCHVSVDVKKLGRAHTSVQWNTEASQRCAYFAEIRESGGDPARAKACPRLADSIKHAVAEGCLEEMSSAPSPGDG